MTCTRGKSTPCGTVCYNRKEISQISVLNIIISYITSKIMDVDKKKSSTIYYIKPF
jgi:hypothetical protein